MSSVEQEIQVFVKLWKIRFYRIRMDNFGENFVCVFEFLLFEGEILYVLILVNFPTDSPGWDDSPSYSPFQMAPQK